MKVRSTSILAAVLVFTGMVATGASGLTIGGAVKQPLNLTVEDLGRMESVAVRLNELTAKEEFRGVFTYKGVPLRSLLELAVVDKGPKTPFSKPLDLAVLVRGKEGKSAVLSWGELFYKNPGDIVLALSATPIMPHHKDCSGCHDAGVYQPALDQFKRKIGFPKLVVANDFFTDRSIEDIVSIEVVDLKGQSEKRKMEKLFSPKFVVSHGKEKAVEISSLAGETRTEVVQKEVGDGRGYHGLKRFGGVPLRRILAKAGIKPGIGDVIIVSSPDGYRALVSAAELFFNPAGERIIIADTAQGKPADENGRFLLVLPDDLAADREVKAIEKIEVISLPTTAN